MTQPHYIDRTCQKCGGEIQGWTCQGCGQVFRENDAGNLVFDAMEAVAWRYSSEQLKRGALAAMRGLANQEPEGWNKDTQLAALAAAEAGDMDHHWAKSEAAIRVFLQALAVIPTQGGEGR